MWQTFSLFLHLFYLLKMEKVRKWHNKIQFHWKMLLSLVNSGVRYQRSGLIIIMKNCRNGRKWPRLLGTTDSHRPRQPAEGMSNWVKSQSGFDVQVLVHPSTSVTVLTLMQILGTEKKNEKRQVFGSFQEWGESSQRWCRKIFEMFLVHLFYFHISRFKHIYIKIIWSDNIYLTYNK